MAAVVESFYTAFIKTEAPTDENPFNQTDPDVPGEPKGPNEYSMGPGQVNVMAPGKAWSLQTQRTRTAVLTNSWQQSAHR